MLRGSSQVIKHARCTQMSSKRFASQASSSGRTSSKSHASTVIVTSGVATALALSLVYASQRTIYSDAPATAGKDSQTKTGATTGGKSAGGDELVSLVWGSNK